MANIKLPEVTNRNPLFAVMFSFQNTDKRVTSIGGYDFEQIHISANIVHSDQLLWIKRAKDKFIVGVEVNEKMWSEAELDGFIDEFMRSVLDIIEDKPKEEGKEELQAESKIETVKEVFRKHLGITSVSESDNFFNLGGHSLLAITVVAELNERFGSKIKIRDILNGTVATLALKADKNDNGESSKSMMDRLFNR